MKKTKFLVLLLFLLCAGSSAEEIRLQLFKNGYCTGNPVCSVDRRGQVYSNGYCTGNPIRSFKRSGKTSQIYLNGYCTGNPGYSVRFDGLATLVRAVYRWEDITMQDTQRKVLKVACDRYRLRNRIGDHWGLKKKNAYGKIS